MILEKYVDQNVATQVDKKVHNDDIIKNLFVDKIMHQIKKEVDFFSNVRKE